MKYLNIEALASLVEFTNRANGKTSESVTESLNILMRSGPEVSSRVLFVSPRSANFEVAQSNAKKLLLEFSEKYLIKILRESRGILAFSYFNGAEKVLHFCDMQAAPMICRGNAYDNVIIDIDLNKLFGCIDPVTFETAGSQLLAAISPSIRRKN
jgi:hypothetical protein